FDMGMPQARMAALHSLAQLAANDSQLFQQVEGKLKRLQAQPGVGDWTAQYIAMRALRDTDSFPAADVVIRRMLTPPGQTRPTPAAVLRRAEMWRPWRSFATVHLWTAASFQQAQSPRGPAAAAATAAGV
ncbi:MAG: hypothetical protein SGI92_01930, partial [Bryobacteraceae bacterium]|nr:hypothetical protein [Bryobacteraceae bacterium]